MLQLLRIGHNRACAEISSIQALAEYRLKGMRLYDWWRIIVSTHLFYTTTGLLNASIVGESM